MLLFHGFSGPNPWLLARVPSTKSNDFNANFSFGIIDAVHSMENQLNFDVTGFKNTQASRDN